MGLREMVVYDDIEGEALPSLPPDKERCTTTPHMMDYMLTFNE